MRNNCDICRVKIENYQIDPFDILITCEEHKKYRKKCNVYAIKKELGLLDSKKIQCEVCSKELTEDESDNIGVLDWLNTCAEHKKYKGVYNLDWLKGILGYADKKDGINYISKEELDKKLSI